MMNHPAHHPPPHPGGAYPPPPPMYAGGPPPPPPGSSHGMPPGPHPSSSASHHPMHHSQPPPPPPPSHGHHGHHLGRGPPPPHPGQTNGIPLPPGGPSPRVMSGAPVVPHGDGGPAMPPPPPRSTSAASQHHMHPHGGLGPYELGGPGQPVSMMQKLAHSNEQAWIAMGSAAEAMEDYERAIAAYESALRHNPYSVPAMNAIAGVHRTMDRFEKAVDYFQRVLNIVPENGETWGAMGHCYLMMDDLQKAYTAYQQALYHLPNPKEPKLWYGIGILYDRYGSLEHAEEAFASVVRMDPNYEKANEIYFRLGIIYKQQNKYQASLECFRYILNNPPRPLTEIDIWFQIGHVYEQQKEFGLAKEAYERVLAENPSHAKVLQQLGWLYHQSNAGFENQDVAIQFLTKSLESDASDAQSWYLLGRAYMAERNYNKAYEAYQQAVYRDGKNPTFWCSIGVLYYQISQYRDALDAYSRAIRLNPYISEVWFDLGSLYESCNNQISDAIDAYARAAELDPDNPHIQQRLTLLRNAEARGEQVSSAPMPQDVHPTAYANHPGSAGPPGPYGGAPPLSAEGGSRDLPGPRPNRHSQSPAHGFRDGPHPSIPNIDDAGARPSAQNALAPMEAPRAGSSPPPPYGSQHGRTSPRSQAYSSRNAEYERERMRERDMAWERGQAGDYGRGYEGGAYPPLAPSQQRSMYPEQAADKPGARGGKNSVTNTPKSMRGKAREEAEVASSPARRKLKDDSRGSSPQAPSRGMPPRRKGAAPGGEEEGTFASPGSESSTASSRPLAAGTPAPAPPLPASRTIDEDYDGSAADALMGLAGAASASAPLTRELANPSEPVPAADEARSNGAEPRLSAAPLDGDSNMTEAEKLDVIKQRAEAAAAEEDRVERSGGAIQMLGKRTALSEDRDETAPEKRVRSDAGESERKAIEAEADANGEDKLKEGGKSGLSAESKAGAESDSGSKGAMAEEGIDEADKATEGPAESTTSAVDAAKDTKDALDKAAHTTVDEDAEKAKAGEASDPEQAKETQVDGEKEEGEQTSAPVQANGATGTDKATDGKTAEPEQPRSRAQSELEEGEVA